MIDNCMECGYPNPEYITHTGEAFCGPNCEERHNMNREPLDERPDYSQDDMPYEPIPCPACGAGPHDPCLETCEAMYPKDMQGTVDWSNVAATSGTHPWEELNDQEA